MSLAILLGLERKTIVRVVYSDESGTGDAKKEPITVVAAMMLNMDSQWRPVYDAIGSAIVEAFDGHPPDDFKLKGRTLYQKIEHRKNRSERYEAYQKLLKLLMIIPRQHHIPIWYGAVDLAGFKYQMSAFRQRTTLKDSRRPFKLALEACMERIDTYVHADCPEEEVLWIHDAGNLNESANLTLEGLRWFRKEAEEVVFENLNIEIPANESHIVDSIYFGNDEESRLLQLADVCCSTITRWLRNDPIGVIYYEILRRQVQNDGVRPSYENAEKLITSVKEHFAKTAR